MKKILLYSTALVALLFAACSKSTVEDVMPAPQQKGEGAVTFNISTHSVAAGEYNPMDYCTIRIYSSEGLIRKYNSQAEMPATLSLLAGDYKIRVDLGDMSSATFTNKSYRGESTFTVVAGQEAEVSVACEPLNATVVVNYDESVAANLTDFSTTVAMGEESLVYDATTSNTGYFLPVSVEGEEVKLAWNFAGTHDEQGELTQSGEFAIEAAKKYTLKIKYTPTATGFLSFEVVIEEPTSTDDVIIFSPEPVFKGEGFDLSESQNFFNTTRTINLTAQSDLKTLTMEIEGTTYDLVNAAPAGVALIQTDTKNWVITLSDELLSAYPGGTHSVKFEAVDADDVTGKNSVLLTTQGIVPGVSDADFWANTGKVSVKIFDANVQSVLVKVRRSGGEWKSYTATQVDDTTYAATLEPEWTTTTNEHGLTVGQPDNMTGIFANASYEAKAVIDGVEKAAVAEFSTSVSQPIPYGDFEDSTLSCFTKENASTLFWGSGNNDYMSLSKLLNLCTQQTFPGQGGNYCARMHSESAAGILAAGNLFSGTFVKPSTQGTVSFGKEYSWIARPTALRFKYYASVIGETNMWKWEDENGNYPIAEGQKDKARIYVAIIDWSATRPVSSGLAAPSGMWDPVAQASVTEGNIIGYASFWITEASTGGQMITVDVPFYYHDTVTKPSNRYTIAISCSSNAYGDYMCGCDTNEVYVDDFEWVY